MKLSGFGRRARMASTCVVVLSLALATIAFAQSGNTAPHGYVYRDTTDCGIWLLYWGYATYKPTIVSPDGRRSVEMVMDPEDPGYSARLIMFRVYEGERLLKTIKGTWVGARAMIKWRPDSSAFALDWSDTGSMGTYHVRVFRIEGDNVVELSNVSKLEDHWDNVEFVRWTEDGNLMVWASRLPAGKVKAGWSALRLSVADGSVLERFSPTRSREASLDCPTVLHPKELEATIR